MYRLRNLLQRIIWMCVFLSSVIIGIPVWAESIEDDTEVMYSALLEEKLFQNTDNTENPVEGYEKLKGIWRVGAIDYDYNDNPAINLIVDIDDSELLSDLYDSNLLSFYADGTFVYENPYIHEGTYMVHPQNLNCYILKTESCYRLSVEDGVVVKIEADSKPSYFLEICDDALHLQEYDAFTGKAKANDNGYYFVRMTDESSFIQENKTELEDSGKDNTSENSGDASSSSIPTSYAGILEEYTQKMKDAVPELVAEYENESAGVQDIMDLAEICNDKVEDLAEICNEGVEKMAELMYEKGDSYDTYSSWAEKLMDCYMDIAQDIQDAYLDSAW